MFNKDYIGDKSAAVLMAAQIQAYYHSKGYTGVIVEVQPRVVNNSQGDRVAVHWDIRSNLKFKVSDIQEGRMFA